VTAASATRRGHPTAATLALTAASGTTCASATPASTSANCPTCTRSSACSSAHRSVVNLDVLDLTDMRLKDGAEATRTDYRCDLLAGARRQGVVQTLASWSRLVDEERRADDLESDLCEDPTIASETGYLLAHFDWIAEQPWFVELHDDVLRMWTDVRRVIGERDPIVYECPTCGWEVQPRYDGTVYTCSGCERNWTMANEVDALIAAQASAMTLTECAQQVGRPVKTLHEWRARGWINPLGKDRGRGQFVFDVRLVQRVAETVRNGKRMEVA
jgi:ribosomal protein L37AE/L43A